MDHVTEIYGGYTSTERSHREVEFGEGNGSLNI